MCLGRVRPIQRESCALRTHGGDGGAGRLARLAALGTPNHLNSTSAKGAGGCTAALIRWVLTLASVIGPLALCVLTPLIAATAGPYDVSWASSARTEKRPAR